MFAQTSITVGSSARSSVFQRDSDFGSAIPAPAPLHGELDATEDEVVRSESLRRYQQKKEEEKKLRQEKEKQVTAGATCP